MREAAQRAGVRLVGVTLGDPIREPEYRRAFAAMPSLRPDALVVTDHAEGLAHQHLIVELAAQGRLPAIYAHREFIEAGGLMSYAPDKLDIHRQAASYIDRILKGANPAELPFQQPATFELLINLKTAKALGLMIPPSVLARADEAIR